MRALVGCDAGARPGAGSIGVRWMSQVGMVAGEEEGKEFQAANTAYQAKE